MNFKKTFISFSTLTILINFNAFAAQNYCTSDKVQSKFIIHIFGESYQNNDDKRLFLRGLDKLQSKFKKGDKIRILSHDGAQSSTKLDKCLPGCPESGNIFNSDCSEQVAKKDMVLFKRKYVKIIKDALKKDKKEYEVLDHFNSLDDFYRGRNVGSQKAYVFHSLLPFGVDPSKNKSYDSNFVKVALTSNLNKISIPNVIFVNPNRTKATLNFWNDLKLNGHKSGLNIKFKTEIID